MPCHNQKSKKPGRAWPTWLVPGPGNQCCCWKEGIPNLSTLDPFYSNLGGGRNGSDTFANKTHPNLSPPFLPPPTIIGPEVGEVGEPKPLLDPF